MDKENPGLPKKDNESWRAKTDDDVTEAPSWLDTWLGKEDFLPGEDAKDKEKKEDEDTSLAGRFRKAFSNLFGKVVEKPEAGEPKEKRLKFGEFLFGRDDKPTPETTATERQVAPETKVDTPVETTVEAADATATTPEPTEVSAPEIINTAPEDGPIRVQNIEPQVRPDIEQIVRQEQAQADVEQVEQKPAEPENHEFYRAGHSKTELSVLAAGLVAAEHVGRKRADKKIKKKLTKEVKKLENETTELKKTQEKIEQTAREQARKFEVLQEKPTVKTEAVVATLVERREAKIHPEKVPNTDRFAEKHIAPEVVLERVSKAAEYDAPLERSYERRQEVKDEPLQTYGHQGATSVSDVISKASSLHDVTQQQAAKQAALLARDANTNRHQGDDAYKSAAMGGLYAALVIIILGVIAYFVVR